MIAWLKRLRRHWHDTLTGDTDEMRALREEHAEARAERERAQDDHLEQTVRLGMRWHRDDDAVDALRRLGECGPAEPPGRPDGGQENPPPRSR